VFLGLELNIGEKVFSSTRDPRFRGKATPLEGLWFVVQEVGDVVEDLWQEVKI
jgi:hypothetical protein